MVEIIIYNLAFWAVYGYICYLPYKIMQYIIDNNATV